MALNIVWYEHTKNFWSCYVNFSLQFLTCFFCLLFYRCFGQPLTQKQRSLCWPFMFWLKQMPMKRHMEMTLGLKRWRSTAARRSLRLSTESVNQDSPGIGQWKSQVSFFKFSAIFKSNLHFHSLQLPVPMYDTSLGFEYDGTSQYADEDSIFLNKIAGLSRMPNHFRRNRRGIVDECCRKSCSLTELSAYCPNPPKKVRARKQSN